MGAMHRWPEAVTMSLWPFALKTSAHMNNEYKLDTHLLSPKEKLSLVCTKQSVPNKHPLFCPVYCLDAKIQGSMGGLPKWEPRS